MNHNLIVICSDQHNPRVSGYAGHRYVKTPNLDRLAEMGTVFEHAYCTNPICTPSRMSFITGRYTHEIEMANNGIPLRRDIMTWARKLDRSGVESTMLGKMDFVGEYQDGGFSKYRIMRRRPAESSVTDLPPYHHQQPFIGRLDGYHCPWMNGSDKAAMSGPRTERLLELDRGVFESGELNGEQDDCIGNYDHDRIVTDWTLDYIRKKAVSESGRPWCLYVGYLFPHEPFVVPEKYFRMYYPHNFGLPAGFNRPLESLPPALQYLRESTVSEGIAEETMRRAMAAYFGMVTCMDDMIGEILDELETHGMLADTHIIYTSDHGESLGENNLFFKHTSYENSVAVPLIHTGPGIEKGQIVSHPISLVDMYATIMDIYGLKSESDVSPHSWLSLAQGQDDPDRPDWVFAEYHGWFVKHGWYMLVRDGLKYTWYEKNRPTLFDLNKDPFEQNNLADRTQFRSELEEFEKLLRQLIDPERVAREAKTQLALIGPDGEDLTESLCVCEEMVILRKETRHVR